MMGAMDELRIEQAGEHNLKGLSLAIPRHRLTVITGVSGSGKSSLAFNIIYAEGQRRYLESLSPYARQFLHLFQKPRVEAVTGLSPAVSVQQNPGGSSGLSTVGTLSEAYDYLRLLFHTGARQLCHRCDRPLQHLDETRILERIRADFAGEPVTVLAPMVRQRKGHYDALFALLARRGYLQVRVDGKVRPVTGKSLNRQRRHTIEAVTGRTTAGGGTPPGMVRMVGDALRLGGGDLIAWGDEREIFYSLRNYCPACHQAFPDSEPSTFSFHSTRHQCAHCGGRGVIAGLAPDILFADLERPLAGLEPDAGDAGLNRKLGRAWHRALADRRIGATIRWADLATEDQDALLGEPAPGDDAPNPATVLLAELETMTPTRCRELEMFLIRERPCPSCRGSRLGPAGRAFVFQDRRIGELAAMPIDTLHPWLTKVLPDLAPDELHLTDLLRELQRRLATMERIGLGYLHLNRSAASLSGGELQRLRLASRLQQRMSGVLYVLDEPSIGLHPRDFHRLIDLLREIRDQGNTVLVVEHDEMTIRNADYVVDLGPGGGDRGGELLYAGPAEGLAAVPESVTGQYLAGTLAIPLPLRRRSPGRNGIRLRGITTNNLRHLDVSFPAGLLTVVTGVSGSGKSSLIGDTLLPVVRAHVAGRPIALPGVDECRFRGDIRRVHFVDQSPVGRTPRSTPATYTGIFDEIRRFFARLPEAQIRGLTPGHFSYNVDRGRCPECRGMGAIKVEMKFLPDVFVTCSRCQGRRYQWDVLKVRFNGHSIADVLDMCISDALDLFRHFPALRRRLQILEDTGMGYVRLGQPTPTLSGGEQQRLKLAEHLLAPGDGLSIYLLDEPTTGLHFAEIEKLCRLLHELVDRGHTVIAIEHNLDFIKQADHLIDLGPGSGADGGRLVYAGPPEGAAAMPESSTGQYLKKYLNYH